jgi:hypothetical protein
VHIIPRSENDSAGFTARKLLGAEEMNQVKEKLKVEKLELIA